MSGEIVDLSPDCSRALTPGERAISDAVFGATFDADAVTVANEKWIWFQPRGTMMTPAGCLHCNPRGDDYRPDYSAEDWRTRGRFVHELVHAWQWQRGIPLAWVRWPFARYGYRVRPGRVFEDYGLEQQAEIVRHAYLQREGVRSPEWPALDMLTPLLPFPPPPQAGEGC